MTSAFDKEDLNRRMNGSVAALKHEFAGLRKDPDFVMFVRSLKPPAMEND